MTMFTQFHRYWQTRTVWVFVILLATVIFGWPLATTRLGNAVDEGSILSTAYRFAHGDLPIRDQMTSTLIGVWYSLILRVYPTFSLLHFNMLGVLLLALTLIAIYLQLSKYIAPHWCGIGALCALPFVAPFHNVFPFYHVTGACAAAWFIYLWDQVLSSKSWLRCAVAGLAGITLLVAVSIKPPLILLLAFPALNWLWYPASRPWTRSGAVVMTILSLPLAVGAVVWLVFVQTIGGFGAWAEAIMFGTSFESVPIYRGYSLLSVFGRPLWEIACVSAGGLVAIGLFVVGWLLMNVYPALRRWWPVVVLTASGIWLFELGREFLLYVVGVRTTILTRHWGHAEVVSLGIWLSALGVLFLDRKSPEANAQRIAPLWQATLLPWALYLYITQVGSSGWSPLPFMAGAPLVALGIAVMLSLAMAQRPDLHKGDHWRPRYARASGWVMVGSVLIFGVASQWAPAFGLGPPGKPRFSVNLPALSGIWYSNRDTVVRLESLVEIVQAQTRPDDYVLAYYRLPEVYYLSDRMPAPRSVLVFPQHSIQNEQEQVDYMLRMNRLPATVLRRSDEPIEASTRPLDIFVRGRCTILQMVDAVGVYRCDQGDI